MQHKVHILYSGSGCALAQVVELGDESNAVVISTDGNLETVGTRKLIGGEQTVRYNFGVHIHKSGIAIIFEEHIFDLLSGETVYLGFVKRDSNFHALIIVIHDGVEDRLKGKPTYLLHFRKVFVVPVQTILAGRIKLYRSPLFLILGDHLLAASGVTGERPGCKR